MNIRIVSGTDRLRLRSHENHRHYAARHGYEYKFDTALYTNLLDPHFRKLRSIQSALDGSDWVFWLDDDAFFTDMSVRLDAFLNDSDSDTFLVICESPINPQGGWTFLSSGQFFLKNDERARDFLNKVLATPVETARAWWNATRYGLFTGGDQDSIVYTLVNDDLLQFARMCPYNAFNNRPYHYDQRLDEHFLIHFAGVPDKGAAIADFARRFGVDETLVLPGEIKPERRAGGYVSRLSRWLGLGHSVR